MRSTLLNQATLQRITALCALVVCAGDAGPLVAQADVALHFVHPLARRALRLGGGIEVADPQPDEKIRGQESEGDQGENGEDASH